MRSSIRAALFLALASSCATTPLLDEQRLVDLTQAFDDAIPHLPNEAAFSYERIQWGRDEMGRWAAGQFLTSEHTGTHLAAPLSLSESSRATQELELQQLIGPIRVIDVTAACRRDRDYQATPADLARHEQDHGRVPIGAAVIVRTGGERYWDNPRRYLGSGDEAAGEGLHFPGLSLELARVLVGRRVDLVGIDGPRIDAGSSIERAAERALAEANVPSLCNLRGLAELPDIGATLIALPMKIAGGTGGPARVVALVP